MSAYGRDRGASRRPSPHRPSGRFKQATAVRDLIEQVVKQAGVGETGKLARLRQAWAEAVGRATAAQSRVLGHKGGVLLVEADTAALAHELTVYHKHLLLKRLRETTKIGLSDLRCRIAGRVEPSGGGPK